MNRKTYYLSNIQWDEDEGANLNLPKEWVLEIYSEDVDCDIEDYLSDKLTEESGFLHKGFLFTSNSPD